MEKSEIFDELAKAIQAPLLQEIKELKRRVYVLEAELGPKSGMDALMRPSGLLGDLKPRQQT